jgi:type II secretory pathway pseudopilin PulG
MRIGRKVCHYLPTNNGFTYIGLMILVAISGIALAGVGIVWHQEMQREREKELLLVGDEYRKAIGSYFESTPGPVKQFPKKLEELLLDNRFPFIKRHIRKLYQDPFLPNEPWGLQLQGEQIVGVYSQSELEPIKIVGFAPEYSNFGGARHYNEWKFIYVSGSPAGVAVPANPVVP